MRRTWLPTFLVTVSSVAVAGAVGCVGQRDWVFDDEIDGGTASVEAGAAPVGDGGSSSGSVPEPVPSKVPEDAGADASGPVGSEGSHAVRGTVSGLAGSGLVLSLNGTTDLPVTANGPFAFPGTQPSGTSYEVKVKTPPSSPAQSCAVTGGAGVMGGADVQVTVSCATLGTVVINQKFDGVTAPALPAGWTSTVVAGGNQDGPWKTAATAPFSAPNVALIGSAPRVTDIVLDSPAISIVSSAAQVSFRNWYDLEDGGEGGVMEIKIGGGAFVDLVTAGGVVVEGGYPRTINLNYQSPIRGRAAWTGNSAGWIVSTLRLPPSAMGQSVVLRWRFASDASGKATDWRIDDVVVTN